MGTHRLAQRWAPYEASPTEGGACLPPAFYRIRWALVHCCPFVRPFFRTTFTWGEVIAVALIVGQLLWAVLHIATSAGWRSDLRGNGAACATHAKST